jgi:hypothetical protein
MTPTNYLPGNQPPRRPVHVPRGAGQKPLAQSPNYRVNDRARSDGHYKGSVLGLAWILASMGVFLRDIGQTIGIFTMVVLFLFPVFYPVTALPEEFRPWRMVNPHTFIIG